MPRADPSFPALCGRGKDLKIIQDRLKSWTLRLPCGCKFPHDVPSLSALVKRGARNTVGR
jgi:hypothetical protein